MKIKIQVLDTLFVRDGKPFSMGEENWANGTFPPPPSVFYGAIRTSYMVGSGLKPKEMNQEKDESRNLLIQNIYLKLQPSNHSQEKVYLPCPLDLVIQKGLNDKKAYSLILEKKSFPSNHPYPYYLKSDLETVLVTPKGYWMDLDSYRNYLEGAKKEFPVENITDYIIQEPKIGIAKSRTLGSIQEGKLYRMSMKRPIHLSFGLVVEGVNPLSPYLKLGAEGKVSYWNEDKDSFEFPKHPDNLGNQLKIVLLTPGIFQGGNIPNWKKTGNLEYNWKGFQFKLLTACVGSPESIGGFDVQDNKPKKMYQCVPAGSVYYLEFTHGDPNEFANLIHGKSLILTEDGVEDSINSEYYQKAKEGFGIVYVGKVY